MRRSGPRRGTVFCVGFFGVKENEKEKEVKEEEKKKKKHDRRQLISLPSFCDSSLMITCYSPPLCGSRTRQRCSDAKGIGRKKSASSLQMTFSFSRIIFLPSFLDQSTSKKSNNKTHRERERLGDLERRPDIQTQQLASHERRRALGAVLEDLEEHVSLDLHRAQRAVGRRRRGGGRERERGGRGRHFFRGGGMRWCLARTRFPFCA